MARILAVDDSAAMRQMVGITLTGAGHQVSQANDGRDEPVDNNTGSGRLRADYRTLQEAPSRLFLC